jgi:murein L,D-transpeptidase YcbB/YkuD
MLAGASLLALATAAPLAALANDSPTDTQPATQAVSAELRPAQPAGGTADDGALAPLPEAPDALIIERLAAKPAAPEPVIAMPAPPDVADTLIVDRQAQEARALAEMRVDVPLPDAPTTLLVDRAASPMPAALRAALETGSLTGPGVSALTAKERQAIGEIYAARDFAPLWLDADGRPTAAAYGIQATLGTAETDALDPNAYPVAATGAAPSAAVRFDVTLTAAAYAYARDARGGRLEPTRLSNLITPDLFIPTPAEVVAKLQAAPDAAADLASWQPQHEGYKALRAKLAEMRETTAAVSGPEPIPFGPVLRTGMSDPRVPALRKRLGLLDTDSTRFDAQVSDAVAEFQRARGLRASGRLDRATLYALDGGRSSGIFGVADIVANMERWRWLPPELGQRHIMVNLPEFTLRLVEDGQVVHRTRVIVGKPETQTPVFSHAMEHVIVNPYWHIPPSILRKEILPKLAQDPDYAAKHGYEVIRRGNSISVRQPPGERNALGFIKFMFPNQHSVYLHDTPSRGLFANARRAYSHGCVRVDQPFRLAEFVLGDQGYSEERMRKMIGTGERMIKLRQQLPVHLTYFTAYVDEAGRLQRLEDIYGHDGKVKTALGVSPDGRRFANLRRGVAQ